MIRHGVQGVEGSEDGAALGVAATAAAREAAEVQRLQPQRVASLGGVAPAPRRDLEGLEGF